MKRSSELAPLSRDHHVALVVARNLARATEDTAQTTSDDFVQFLARHELAHFGLEESLLLPALPDAEGARELAERVRADHQRLRDALHQLQGSEEPPDLEFLQATGQLLQAHVRFEERELFPYLEHHLDARALAELGDRIAERD